MLIFKGDNMKIIKIISNFIEDVFVISGLSLITYATFLISKIAAIYVLGTILLLIGLLLSVKASK
ncbi:hypothetical protein [Caloranaerobacter ferrireducens]|uniref:hypothetical protein n=1 Tax=Caloranaerobacter ferrireducens TaxID=1323370 RepID=UPI00159F0626|nr:hypothetical protein [Caloranaerobacter ferrireducens]